MKRRGFLKTLGIASAALPLVKVLPFAPTNLPSSKGVEINGTVYHHSRGIQVGAWVDDMEKAMFDKAKVI